MKKFLYGRYDLTFKNWLWFRLVLAFVVILLLFISNAAIGTIVIGIYFDIELVFKLNSRWNFGLAFLVLFFVPILLSFHKTQIADSYAIDAFYLISSGLVMNLVENSIN